MFIYKFWFLFIVDSPYRCNEGQGESGKVLEKFQFCERAACEKKCNDDIRCEGFDYTENTCSCRLFPIYSTPRTGGGTDNRIYCEKMMKENSMNLYDIVSENLN